MSEIAFSHDRTEEGGRYLAILDGHEAELNYRIVGPGVIDAYHTGVPKALGGKGVGKAIVAHMIADARARGWRVRPGCSFIEVLFKRNAAWADLLD